ncbi:MAG: hypothetical protein LW817_04115 [Candidatus Caenarcaniphilales bacterium]|jgi:hypothetical protein|nr:hypothetical protein [Candidatus Caenarcaniphilales bacterium]
MLSQQEYAELNNFLNRLQGKIVRVELSTRLNIGYRVSYSLKLEKQADSYNFTGSSGDVSVFMDPNQAEAFSSDNTSVTLLYGDNLITVRYSRTR